MGKATRYYVLDLIMAALAILLAVSSLLLWVAFPRGYSPARRLWVDVHKWGGLAIGVAVCLHVALHWAWLIRMTRRHLSHLRSGVRQTIRHPARLAQDGQTGGQ
jgi:hypothetical protein